MILHVIKSKIYSGAENVVCQIIKGLSDREEFIYMAPHGPIEDKLKSIGLYDNYYGIDKLDVASIKAAVEKFHPTVVHAHDFTASVLCAFALKGSVPIISHLHNNPPWIQKFHYKTISYLMACKYIDHILMVSDAVRDEYRYTSKLKCPITIVGNPFSVDGVKSQVKQELFEADGAGVSGEAGSLFGSGADVSDGTGVSSVSEFQSYDSDLLFVGRLTEQKNPLLVLEVAKELANAGLVKRVRIVGDGELMPELQQYVTNAGLSDVVVLEGFKKNSYDYMACTEVLMMPSKWEGFGLVALEAMSLGVPVVSTNSGGLIKIMDNSCGFVCDSKEEFVAAITTLLTDADLYASKSSGATKRAMEYNNIDEYCGKLLDIYRSFQ
ncbi:Glycosyltransferase involved in cell wall bisynthesis [Pseudobutyrivibrio ruminis]|uniref:Glycosyltransferase involved in cell wall bisynthesis n=1 Tax=Pseudobutyrivibrio ruminis TaxID=46206 RepID=A0A1H7GXW2_9FIRM|nr:glycosyltransferase [Pseudobutyrivibrio ruminis]SEK42986.1 Glycosyltransferase involved in cell wall bisynthesis [Pseudobutyrivibrio ruminis]